MEMEFQNIIDLIVSAIVIGAVAYFFWKFRQIDQHATKKELAESHGELSEEISELGETIPDDYITPAECGSCAGSNVEEYLTSHYETQRIERQEQTTQIMDRIGEVKSDLGREIGDVKGSVNTLDARFHAHITKEGKTPIRG